MKWLLALAVLALAGCSDGQDAPSTTDSETSAPTGTPTPTPAPPVEVDVRLTGAYPVTIAYEPLTIEVPAGSTVSLTFTNTDQNPLPSHDWVLEGVSGVATEVIPNGESSTVVFVAPAAGDYAFYCSIQGHRENGMEGTFTVA